MEITHMAEINMAAGAKKAGLRKRKVLSTRVDLTPMVDLGFLLITFFIFTTTMDDPRQLDLNMPKDAADSSHLPESTSLTVIPLGNDSIFYYHGQLEDALQNRLTGFTGYDVGDGIGNIIRRKQQALDGSGKFARNDLMLLIKPSTQSVYKNLVDMMDEVLVNNISRYAVMDLSEGEQAVIAGQVK